MLSVSQGNCVLLHSRQTPQMARRKMGIRDSRSSCCLCCWSTFFDADVARWTRSWNVASCCCWCSRSVGWCGVSTHDTVGAACDEEEEKKHTIRHSTKRKKGSWPLTIKWTSDLDDSNPHCQRVANNRPWSRREGHLVPLHHQLPRELDRENEASFLSSRETTTR